MSRLADFQRAEAVAINFDGCEVQAHPGETLAAVLLAAGELRFRDDRGGHARGPFCNMGTCSECMVWLAGDHGFDRRRACLVPVVAGMTVRTREPEFGND
ncbi:MAG: (2Fe-2S)-binding protein [Sphingomonadales bacterium]|nr:MAG: (2Fe-2S)-binding protein [Sphingomonadales bacterium]